MYVCNCKGLNETRVRAVIRSGAGHVAKVFQGCGEAPQCARCVPRIAALIKAEKGGGPASCLQAQGQAPAAPP